MAQTISHEAKAPVKTDDTKGVPVDNCDTVNIPKDVAASISESIMRSASIFRFLADTFAALDAADAKLELSPSGAFGLYSICAKEAEALGNAYSDL